jgi:hypothetical protein
MAKQVLFIFLEENETNELFQIEQRLDLAIPNDIMKQYALTDLGYANPYISNLCGKIISSFLYKAPTKKEIAEYTNGKNN